MLSHDLRRDQGILVLKPDGPLEASDFDTVTGHVDAYLEQNGTLRGVMIDTERFPGWKDFSALIAHFRFVKNHHQKIDKVAVVADRGLATIMPHMASRFIHAEVKHFDHAHESAAWDWLLQGPRSRPPAGV